MPDPRPRPPLDASATRSDLRRLLDDVAAARSVLNAERGNPQRVVSHTEAAQAELLDRLEAYAAALSARGMPLPPHLRDELRLRRRLRPGPP